MTEKISSKLFIYPTDTVWGIGSNIYDEASFKEIARIKKTTTDKPLSVMFTDLSELQKSFRFPFEMNEEWLRLYFEKESTLGMPVASANIVIPTWVHCGSDMVSLRFSNIELLKKIPAPFFTTSLNLTGEPPITHFNEVLKFHQQYAPEAKLIGDESHKLSGRSSTIVFFRNNGFEVIRAGAMIEPIKKHLALTGFDCR